MFLRSSNKDLHFSFEPAMSIILEIVKKKLFLLCKFDSLRNFINYRWTLFLDRLRLQDIQLL